jgi:hypothetical protein
MRETRLSGSEGGGEFKSLSLPLSIPQDSEKTGRMAPVSSAPFPPPFLLADSVRRAYTPSMKRLHPKLGDRLPAEIGDCWSSLITTLGRLI